MPIGRPPEENIFFTNEVKASSLEVPCALFGVRSVISRAGSKTHVISLEILLNGIRR